jgi:hypothetical protein
MNKSTELNTEFSIDEVGQIMYDLMYGKKQLNLLQAYSTVKTKYKIDYSYNEMKDYLFHHQLSVSLEE